MLTKPKKLKILLYGNVFRDYRSQVLLKILLEFGHHVSLVCPDFYRNPKIGKFALIDKLVALVYLSELLLKAPFADLIYLPPMNSRFIKSALWMAKIFQKKLIVEMYISIYDTYVGDRKPLKGKTIEPNSRKANDMLKKDKLALAKSDYIIHTANYEVNYWKKVLNVEFNREKVFIAPNFNVSQLIHKRKYRANETLKICWWGTFIPLHGLENILQAMKILQTSKVRFECTLFGIDHPLFEKYQKQIEREQLEDSVSLRKDLKFSDGSLPRYLTDYCDLALGIFGNTDKAYNAVPNKLIEALSMGIPTLTLNSPALKEFFEPGIDLWTCAATPESIAEAIVNIAKGSAYSVDWQKTRQKVLKTFSINRYREVLNRVLETVADDLCKREVIEVESSIKVC